MPDRNTITDEGSRQRLAVDWDRLLLERFREGDREAFSALYRAHHVPIFRFILSMTGDHSKADEVTQEVFVWLIHHPGKFDPSRGVLSAFLMGVARKLLHRSERQERRWLPLVDALRIDAAVTNVDIEIDAAAVRKAISLLPFRYREAVVLCELESRSYEEAAAVLGCAVGTIRSRLRRGRDLLERKFQSKRRWL